MGEEKTVKRVIKGKDSKDLESFLNDPEKNKYIQPVEKDEFKQCTYLVKTDYWYLLKELSAGLTKARRTKTTINMLINEAVGMLFEKYGIKFDEKQE